MQFVISQVAKLNLKNTVHVGGYSISIILVILAIYYVFLFFLETLHYIGQYFLIPAQNVQATMNCASLVTALALTVVGFIIHKITAL